MIIAIQTILSVYIGGVTATMMLFALRRITLWKQNGEQITDIKAILIWCLAYPYTLYRLLKWKEEN